MSKQIADIVSNADHNNYFAAESLHMGDEKAWLRAKLIDVGARQTRATVVSAPDPFFMLPTRMRRERGGAGRKGS